ncbi:ferrous iron transporter B [Ferrovum sp. PN-J185]|uniref:ferrous iron transporter B n=1 Tax=Ferrovum sp. PN-J185 TaxID=1356306 RepID=UPI000795E338|nr:ferrous iron transporter B [Ferrovum sp. PN-J185]KXW56253.1 ferrous iron transport protein B [Ferrovum sp. PN-J185]MCC6068977.1 ferrous iron transporter B [Ferrovum sp. PN-J185]MDE1891043.1 ferrous iron transporter B [Betaproteobacteria bacterium]MDE2055645.1 ferrous iron transporter B [Betaproteobacteria bacterium]
MKTSYIAALVGAPNCGKTALFNRLTGSRQKVANYAGVTVEKKEGDLNCPSGQKVHVIDLPGTYSLTPTSLDESITRRVVMGQLKDEVAPDLLVCVVDSTNLRLHLRLVLELTRLKKPMVLVLNMMDVAKSQGLIIDVDKLSQELEIPVVSCVAVNNEGAQELVDFLDHCNIADNQSSVLPWKDPTPNELQEMQQRVREIIRLSCDESARKEGLNEKLDNIVMHPVWGMIILACVLFFTFQAVFSWANLPMDAIKSAIDWLSNLINHWLPQGLLRSLLVDGIISGAGSVLQFLPQILILFTFILALEDSGYLPRAAFLLDRIMGSVGLSGRSFIPLLSSFACAIPGIMATRTIQNPRDRLTTILIAPLMTCSARLPVYGLLIAAFIPNRSVGGLFNLQGLVLFSLYMGGILSAMIVAFVLKKTIGRRHYQPLMMELPSYRLPHMRNLLMGLLERAEIFTSRVGKIILPMMVILWFLSSYPIAPAHSTEPAITYSFAGSLGKFLEHIFAPIGFNWQICLALVPGLAAREVAVGALGTVYALASEGGEVNTSALAPLLHHSWGLATALSLLVWYIFAPQCVATLGAVKRETNSWRIPSIMLTYLFLLGYLASFVTYQLTLNFGG